jgi:hypothetical protein
LGALVINIAESIDDDEQLRVMSDLVGYRYFDETLNLLDGLENAPHEGYHRAKASFLAATDAAGTNGKLMGGGCLVVVIRRQMAMAFSLST